MGVIWTAKPRFFKRFTSRKTCCFRRVCRSGLRRGPGSGCHFEHVVNGSEDGIGDSTDGLLGAAAGSNAQVLSVEVSLLGARGRPCAFDQSGLEPRGTLFHARGAAFSSAFVVLAAESGPGNQIAFGGESVLSQTQDSQSLR